MVHRLPDQTNELTVDFRNMAELAKKTQQRLYFLSVIRKNNISQKLWVSFYQYSIESILYYCFCVWFSAPQQHREKHSSESLRLPRKPSTVLYPLLKNCTGPTAVGKPRTLKKCTWLNRSHNRSIKASSHQGIRHHLAPCVKDVQYWHTCDGVPMQLCYRLRKALTLHMIILSSVLFFSNLTLLFV